MLEPIKKRFLFHESRWFINKIGETICRFEQKNQGEEAEFKIKNYQHAHRLYEYQKSHSIFYAAVPKKD